MVFGRHKTELLAPDKALAGRSDRRFKDIHRLGKMCIRDSDRCQEAHHVSVDAAGQKDQPAFRRFKPNAPGKAGIRLMRRRV